MTDFELYAKNHMKKGRKITGSGTLEDYEGPLLQAEKGTGTEEEHLDDMADLQACIEVSQTVNQINSGAKQFSEERAQKLADEFEAKGITVEELRASRAPKDQSGGISIH